MNKNGSAPRSGLEDREALTQNLLLAGCLPAHLERLLLRLIWISNEQGNAWIGEAELARTLRVTARAVHASVKQLIEFGFVEHRRPRRPQAGEVGVYHLHPSTISAAIQPYLRRHLPRAQHRDPLRLRSNTMEQQYGERL